MLRFRFCSAALLGIIFVWVGGISVASAQTSSVCDQALPIAEEQYVEGAHDEALRLVAACLTQSDRSDEQGLAAYRMLAMIHLKRDELSRARAAVLNLFGIDPTYRADPIVNPPAYTSLVRVVREDLQDPVRQETSTQRDRVSFFRRTSTWITVGSVLAGSGVATYFALGDGNDGGQGGNESPTAPAPGSGALPIPPGAPPN